MEETETCLCHAEEIFAILGKKWVIPIINIMGNSTKVSFNEIAKKLPDTSPSLISKTIRALLFYKIAKKTSAGKSPSRVLYELTPEGNQLRRIIVSMEIWIVDGKIDAKAKECNDELMIFNV
ncbi:MAG: helix-turn-helix domain-containing protein [Thermoplasmataceae archaeon]|jgi:DNA-binding HxlR family transcriptional regulator|nr:MAG: transcriptional regulator, HxlR family [Thermoplasmatales archaeon E-plasma]